LTELFALHVARPVTEQACCRAERIRRLAPPEGSPLGVSNRDHTSTLLMAAKEGFVTALEAGLLTLGSSYWLTPSERLPDSWPILLAVVPDHSGASARELHPLLSSSTSRATTAIVDLLLTPDMVDVKSILA